MRAQIKGERGSWEEKMRKERERECKAILGVHSKVHVEQVVTE